MILRHLFWCIGGLRRADVVPFVSRVSGLVNSLGRLGALRVAVGEIPKDRRRRFSSEFFLKPDQRFAHNQ